jgi:MFS family permease
MRSDTATMPIEISRPALRRLRMQTMRVSIFEGAFALIMIGLSEAFYIPYLNALGASHLQIGLGASLPAFMSGLVQLIAPIALRRSGTRRRLIVPTVAGQALAFIPLGLVWYLDPHLQVWSAIAAFVISAIFGNMGASAWADWMASVVPRRRRGKYFAFRNRLLGIVQISIAVLGGYLLDKAIGKVMLMFTAIWFACSFARLASAVMFHWYYEPPVERHPDSDRMSFMDFLKDLHTTRFGVFTVAASLLSLGVNMSGPFFAVHMLNNLQLNYISYTILIVTPIAATIATLGLWGRIIDRFGSLAAIRLSAIIVCLLPLPWVVTTSYTILLIVQVISGFSWSGFNLASFTFYVGSLKPHERINHIAYFNTINFMCAAAGSTLGGVILPYLPQVAQWHLQSIFVFSSIVRLCPAVMFRLMRHEEYKGTMSTFERFFFDPMLTLRTGVTSSIMRHFKRQY